MHARYCSSPPGAAALDACPLKPGAASRLGLGTHGLHRLLSSGARQALLHHAMDLGVRHFDTAPSYGDGLAEREIGRFAQGMRSELLITTKFGIPASRALSRMPGLLYAARAAGAITRRLRARRAPPRDYSAAHARTSLEQSLRALRTSYVDVLYLHEPDISQLPHMESLLAVLESLKAGGSVRHIGLSGSAAACARIALAHPALAQVLQIEVAADSAGLPRGDAAVPAAAVRFWEFPAARRSPRPELAAVMHGLTNLAPAGTILLSTHRIQLLRDCAGLILGAASRT
jgi:hypothetical protein